MLFLTVTIACSYPSSLWLYNFLHWSKGALAGSNSTIQILESRHPTETTATVQAVLEECWKARDHDTVSKLPFLPFLKWSRDDLIFNVVLVLGLSFSIHLGKDFLSKCNLEQHRVSSSYRFKNNIISEVTESRKPCSFKCFDGHCDKP